MAPLQWIWEKRNRARVLLTSATLTVLIALVDWRIEPYVSLGFLYLFPIMLAAGFLPRWAIPLLGAACAILSETADPSFSDRHPPASRDSDRTRGPHMYQERELAAKRSRIRVTVLPIKCAANYQPGLRP
jgi:hypothetical protein